MYPARTSMSLGTGLRGVSLKSLMLVMIKLLLNPVVISVMYAVGRTEVVVSARVLWHMLLRLLSVPPIRGGMGWLERSRSIRRPRRRRLLLRSDGRTHTPTPPNPDSALLSKRHTVSIQSIQPHPDEWMNGWMRALTVGSLLEQGGGVGESNSAAEVVGAAERPGHSQGIRYAVCAGVGVIMMVEMTSN